MADLEIPINSIYSSQEFSIALEGVRYKMRAFYSFRQAIWKLDIFTDKETDILLGIKLIPNYPLIGRYTTSLRPPGEITAIDKSGSNVPPGRYELGAGRRVRLVYTESI